MNKSIPLALAFLLAVHTVQARFIALWTYRELTKQADCVMIVSVAQPTVHTGKRLKYWGLEVERALTKFDVRAVLKGDYTAPTWTFEHFVYPVDDKPTIDISSPPFGEFKQAREFFLVFLKKKPDGTLEPLEGLDDLDSFKKLSPDSTFTLDELRAWQRPLQVVDPQIGSFP